MTPRIRHTSTLLLAGLMLAAQLPAAAPIDGVRDPGFGGNGVASASFNLADDFADSTAGMAVAASGRTYLAASVGVAGQGATPSRFGLARFLADGQLDSAFSGDGLASPTTAALNGFSAFARAVAVRPDGKPLVAGVRASNALQGKLLVCRYNVAGNFDTSFDGDGCAEPTLALFDNGAEYALALQSMPEDRVLLAGYVQSNPADLGDFDGLLMLLNADGSLAESFGSLGHVLVRPPGATFTRIADVERLADGRLLAFGQSDAGSFVARFFANGSIDTSFGANGYALFGFGDLHSLPQPREIASAGAVDAQGRIYFCGHVRFDNNIYKSVMALARLTVDGGLDPGFSDDGRLVRPFIDVLVNSNVHGCQVDTQDRLVVAANPGTQNPVNADYGALRLTSDGQPDLSFNSVGQTRVVLDFGGNGVGHDELAGMALVGDDVLLAGTSSPLNGYSSTGEKLTMVRLASDRMFSGGFEN